MEKRAYCVVIKEWKGDDMAFVCVHKTTKRDSSHGVTGGELCLLYVRHYRVCVFFFCLFKHRFFLFALLLYPP